MSKHLPDGFSIYSIYINLVITPMICSGSDRIKFVLPGKRRIINEYSLVLF